jgi:hypothetical protein
MLAYLSWHRSAGGVEQLAYEQALERFHRSLARRPPSGFRGSTSFRLSEPDWPPVAGGPLARVGYEDWYLLEDWSAVGVLEEAVVSRGHLTAHDRIAKLAATATGSVYRLVEGCARLDVASVVVWVARAPGHQDPSLAALLGDGMEPERGGLWRRCLGLGPAPEFCLLVGDAEDAEGLVGVMPTRLPAGWSTAVSVRTSLWGAPSRP